jgi:hypothetical protein
LNPDVAAAYLTNSYGMTPEQYAAAHYSQYGQYEQRTAPSTSPFANATQGFGQNFQNYQSIPIGAQYNPNVVGGTGSPYSQIMGQMRPNTPAYNPYLAWHLTHQWVAMTRIYTIELPKQMLWLVWLLAQHKRHLTKVALVVMVVMAVVVAMAILAVDQALALLVTLHTPKAAWSEVCLVQTLLAQTMVLDT